MTGKEYTFKQVGHAMAVIGYIYKWYAHWHGLYPSVERFPFSEEIIDKCPVCKYYYSIVNK